VSATLRVFRDELATRRRSILSLTAGTFVFALVVAATYTAFGGTEGFTELLGRKTPGFFSAFAGDVGVNIFLPANYLAFGFTHPMFLVLTLSVGLSFGAGAIAGDVETGRAEMLYVRPIRRTVILDAKLGAWAVAQVVVVGAGALGLWTGALVSDGFGTVDAALFLRFVVQYLPVTAVFGAAAFAASAFARTRGHALGAAAGAAAVAYLVNFIALLWFPLRWARHLTPFGYYSPIGAVSRVDLGDIAVLLVVAVGLIAVARWELGHRDLV
jgi:ABC-type transport system involved in multi-copper enzyme maturation permease subunit